MRHPDRAEPQSFNMYTRPKQAVDAPPPLGALPGAVLSVDAGTGSITALVTVPPRWTAHAPDALADLELFVLHGELSLEGETVGSGGFVQLPAGSAGAVLASGVGAEAIAFWTPNAINFPAPYARARAVRTWDLPWLPAAPGAHGLLCKSLRAPDVATDTFDGGPGGFVRMFLLASGTQDDQQHVHDECWEEVITLGGDVLMADEGLTARGSVLGHPRGFFHGPFASHAGAVLLVHTDAPMGAPWPKRDQPGGPSMVREYLDDGDWRHEPAHESWPQFTKQR